MTARVSTPSFSEKFLKIKTKDGRLIPFKCNNAQVKLNETIEKLEAEEKPVRIIILKARQMGFSTFTEAHLFKNTTLNKHTTSGIITHKDTATNNLFKMSKTFYDYLPPNFKPTLKKSNSKELIFDAPGGTGLNSQIKVMTAGGDGVGRSDTYTNLHISEYAFWKGDKRGTLTDLLQSVPSIAGTCVIIESTANGFEEFKELWDKSVNGENDFVPLFFPWYDEPSYRKPYWGFPLTEEEEKLKKQYNLDNEQLSWRRWSIANNCDGEIDKFHQEYPSNPAEAFLSTGRPIFNKELIIDRLNNVEKPLIQGFFDVDKEVDEILKYEFTANEKGCIKIYEEPKKGHPYILAGDTAGEGSDFFTGQVLDSSNGKQVATLKIATDDDLYNEQMYCLGMHYNYAFLIIEANFTPYPIKMLYKMGYTNQYIRIVEDSYSQTVQKYFGFKTTVRTKPLIISNLRRIFKENPELIVDSETLNEMLKFVHLDDVRMGASSGHDDLVMALAIAYHAFVSDQVTHDIDKDKFDNGRNKNSHFWALEEDDQENGEYIVWE